MAERTEWNKLKYSCKYLENIFCQHPRSAAHKASNPSYIGVRNQWNCDFHWCIIEHERHLMNRNGANKGD